MKISKVISILEQIKLTAGDLKVSFAFPDEEYVAFIFPDAITVLGSDGDPDTVSFVQRDLMDQLTEECDDVQLPAIIRVVGSGSEEVH